MHAQAIGGRTRIESDGRGIAAQCAFTVVRAVVVVRRVRVVTCLMPRPGRPVQAIMVVRVRLGQHSDKVRIVLDVDRHVDLGRLILMQWQ